MLPAQLIAWRKAGAMSRETAAKLLGCSAKSLERYESGQRTIPDEIATATLGIGKEPDAGVELAPPYDKRNPNDTPWGSPRLWQRMPGKKVRWERIEAGKPLLPATAAYDPSIVEDD